MSFSVHMDGQLLAPLAIFRPWIRVLRTPKLKHHILTINEDHLTMQHITI